ncbi:Protein AGENET DOMAIN (AGD)-CONTAINING P1 [Linum perenne]
MSRWVVGWSCGTADGEWKRTTRLEADDGDEFRARFFLDLGRTNFRTTSAPSWPLSAAQQNMILIKYHTLFNGSIPTKELICSASVRPAPSTEYGAWFKVEDNVDVNIDDGWHKGTVKGIHVNSNYLMGFARQSEGIVAEHCTLRHHRKWNDGAWFRPPPPLVGGMVPPRYDAGVVTLVWEAEDNGCFSIKSMYAFIKNFRGRKTLSTCFSHAAWPSESERRPCRK